MTQVCVGHISDSARSIAFHALISTPVRWLDRRWSTRNSLLNYESSTLLRASLGQISDSARSIGFHALISTPVRGLTTFAPVHDAGLRRTHLGQRAFDRVSRTYLNPGAVA
jgi:hypothetical protein